MPEIIRTIEELPHLRKDYMRLVHRTSNPNPEEGILQRGFDYSRQGLDLTTHAFGDPKDAENYALTGKVGRGMPFEYPGNNVFIFDLPQIEYRKHRSVTNAPGLLPNEYLVGVIHIKDSKQTLDKLLISFAGITLLISIAFFTRITGNIMGNYSSTSLGTFFIIISFLSFGAFLFNRRRK